MKRILIVEDNLVNQKLFGLILKENYIVDFANNGEESLYLLRRKEFDLVLMDYAMPVMDGAKTTSIIRNTESRFKNIPIIMITTNILEEDRRYCLKCGVNEYLLKPISPEKLLCTIERYFILL